MERRLVIFLVASFAFLLLYYQLFPPQHRPAKEQAPVAVEKDKLPAEKGKLPKEKEAEKGKKLAAEAEKAPPAIEAAHEPAVPDQWVTLGSVDDDAPYRMLVTLSNKGAAVARIELSSPRYCDIDDRGGYLGHVVMEPQANNHDCVVQVVGPGTPAAEAGLKPGDVIKSIDGKPVTDAKDLMAGSDTKELMAGHYAPSALARMKPKQRIELVVSRDGKELNLTATLRRRPLEVIKPEGDDPLSMLLTLQQFDDKRLVADEEKAELDKAESDNKTLDAAEKELLHEDALRRELKGVNLRTANWKVLPRDKEDEVKFQRTLPDKGLEITKTYRLVRVPQDSLADPDFPAYNLVFEIEIRNTGKDAHKVAYRLDGPNGLPAEGWWYATRVTRSGGSGLRDFVISFGGNTPSMVGAAPLATGKKLPSAWPDKTDLGLLSFIGVDAQYFAAVLIPDRGKDDANAWFDGLMPIRVGKPDVSHPTLTNASCRLVGAVKELKPGETIANKFQLFAGPKKPSTLKPYGLSELVYFGWPIFSAVAVPLTAILHFFFSIVRNYGLAIILLTVFVRGCMFPLSRKQAIGAQKMQQLQPEIKKLQEKFKNNAEGRTKAQQELFRKHNYNPLSGCLPIFIQMPVFIGLYRSLMVAIELRDAPLLTHAIRWCSNLAAPDMLYKWSGFMPSFIVNGPGLLWLGPYFNLMPILTIILFIWQQKMFMPPAADEQAAMQQKVMQYMMIFMGLMFFKVASGLCIYFIASSLWGLAERKFLPKTKPVADTSMETRAEAKARARQEEAAKAKKMREK